MTFQEEMAALQARIAKAHIERDTWRASGQQQKYLDAHSMIEALELRLQALRQEALRQQAARDFASREAAPPMPAARAPEAPDEAQRETMRYLGITFEDGVYRLGAYRYGRLDDAVSYARLLRLLPPS